MFGRLNSVKCWILLLIYFIGSWSFSPLSSTIAASQGALCQQLFFTATSTLNWHKISQLVNRIGHSMKHLRHSSISALVLHWSLWWPTVLIWVLVFDGQYIVCADCAANWFRLRLWNASATKMSIKARFLKSSNEELLAKFIICADSLSSSQKRHLVTYIKAETLTNYETCLKKKKRIRCIFCERCHLSCLPGCLFHFKLKISCN